MIPHMYATSTESVIPARRVTASARLHKSQAYAPVRVAPKVRTEEANDREAAARAARVDEGKDEGRRADLDHDLRMTVEASLGRFRRQRVPSRRALRVIGRRGQRNNRRTGCSVMKYLSASVIKVPYRSGAFLVLSLGRGTVFRVSA